MATLFKLEILEMVKAIRLKTQQREYAYVINGLEGFISLRTMILILNMTIIIFHYNTPWLQLTLELSLELFLLLHSCGFWPIHVTLRSP